METTVEKILNFVAAAEKSRKYPANTADAIGSALRLFDKSLNEEERASVDTFRDRLPQIYQDVVRQNLGKNYTAGSLEVYRKRVQKVLKDYYQYGVDMTKMAGWEPKIRERRSPKQDTHASSKSELNGLLSNSDAEPLSIKEDEIKHLIPFGNGRRALLIYSSGLSEAEATRLKKQIDVDTV